MADNVQWIKLRIGIFDDYNFKKMKRAKLNDKSIRDKLTAVWFEFLDLASQSKNKGYILKDIEDIAVMLDREEDEIRNCVDFYIKNKMLYAHENGLYITNFGYKNDCKYVLDCGDKRTTQLYKDWRLCVLDRDNFTCQKCGATNVCMHVHHIKMWSEYPEDRFKIENGMTLCSNCHKKIHSKGKRNGK